MIIKINLLIIIFCVFNLTLSELIKSDDLTSEIVKNECPEGWIKLNSYKCIFYSHRKMTFYNSQSYCKKKMNARLMMPYTKDENKQLSRIMFDQLQYDEYFWLGGKVINNKGDFRWLDNDNINKSCLPTDYNNFHINNHEFHLDVNEEYLVLSSAMNENKNKLKERGTWCSFSPNIMIFAICEYKLSNNTNLNCEYENNQIINPPYNLSIETTNKILNDNNLKEHSNENQPFITITKIQAYFIIGLFLMSLLLIGLIFILKASFSNNSQATIDEQFEV